MVKIDRFPKYEFTKKGTVVSRVSHAPKTLKPIRMGEYVGLQLLRDDGTTEKQYLHRLICEAFHGPCPDGRECRHLDGNKKNNRPDNLAWGTSKQNSADQRRHGTTRNGENNPMARLTQKNVLDMRQRRALTGDSYAAIARDFSVSTMTAYRAITKQSWSNTQ